MCIETRHRIFYRQSSCLIRKIKDLGHNIGLHQNPPLMDMEKLGGYIMTDIQILEHFYGFEIDRFAFHRPKKEYLKNFTTQKAVK